MRGMPPMPPQETLLRVVECLVESRISATREMEEALRASNNIPMRKEDVLGNLALVCRAWCALVAPALYDKLMVTDKGLGSPLRQSLAQHARQIAVLGDRLFATSAKNAQLAPRPSPAVFMMWVGPEEAPQAAYHPLHAVAYAQAHRSYSNVATLALHHCAFLSSSDLLRLLASFTALEQVFLSSVSVVHVSDSVVRQGRPSASPIRLMTVDENCTPPRLSFLTYCWTWPRKPPNDQAPPFHGLLPAEQRLVARVHGLMLQPAIKSSFYQLFAIDNDGEICE